MCADIHDGQEHKRSVQGPDTEAQDQSSPDHQIQLATHGRSIQRCQKLTTKQAAKRGIFTRFSILIAFQFDVGLVVMAKVARPAMARYAYSSPLWRLISISRPSLVSTTPWSAT